MSDLLSTEAVDLLREILYYERAATQALERLSDLALDVEAHGGGEHRELLQRGLIAPQARFHYESDLHTPLTTLTPAGRDAARWAEDTIAPWRP